MWFARGATVFRAQRSRAVQHRRRDERARRRARRRALGRDDRRGGADRAGRRDDASTVTACRPARTARGIAAGPDGRMWMTLDRSPYLVRITVPPRVTDAQHRVDLGSRHRDPQRARHRGPRGGPAGRRDVAERGKRERRRRHQRVPGRAGAARARERPQHLVRVRATNAAGSAVSAGVELASRATPSRRPIRGRRRPPAPPPTPPEVTVAPVPVQGKTVVLTAGTGTVRIKAPGQDGYIDARQHLQRAGRLAHRHHRGQRRAGLARGRQDAVGHLPRRQVPRRCRSARA